MKTPLYVIVRFHLEAGEIEKLSALITEFFQKEVSAYPGFIASRIHRNEEGTVLINYAQWESIEKFNGFRQTMANGSELSRQIRLFNQVTDLVYEIPYQKK